jgi:arylsulfatase A-like enzyme
MMGFIDIYPTIKRIAGVTGPDPNPLDGQDMLDVIRGRALAPKREWFSYIAQGTPDQTAVCDGTWKLVVRGGSVLDVELDGAGRLGPLKGELSVELFRLDQDPGEKTNLAAEHPEIVARLLKNLKEFRRLKPDGVPPYTTRPQGYKAPQDWMIR